jgi:hypothetical protein
MSRISRGSLSKWQGLLLRCLVTRARFVAWVGVSSSRSRLSTNIIRRRFLLFVFIILANELMRSVECCGYVDLSGREGCRLGLTEKRDYKGEGSRPLARHSPLNVEGRSPPLSQTRHQESRRRYVVHTTSMYSAFNSMHAFELYYRNKSLPKQQHLPRDLYSQKTRYTCTNILASCQPQYTTNRTPISEPRFTSQISAHLLSQIL